jgi:trimethylamine--corrinoid protein Co-methyltransferase
MLEDMSTIAYEQFVIDNEILGMAMRAVRGIEVNQDTLALDAIDRVGPGNHFLSDQHTFQYLRSEHYFPSSVLNRKGREEWEAEGGSDARQEAIRIAKDLLASHQPLPIDPEICAWIENKFAETLVLTK